MKKLIIIFATSIAMLSCAKKHTCPSYNNAGSNSLDHHHNGEHKPLNK